MARCSLLLLPALLVLGAAVPFPTPAQPDAAPALKAGFAEADITPAVGAGKPVYLAGFGKNRRASGVHDPLMVRALVLDDGARKVALVAVDLVGFFLPDVERVRAELPGFHYVMVSATHNHEGPDTLGLWGPTAFQSGVDPAYLATVRRRIVDAVWAADRERRPVSVRCGSARAPELLHDAREPIVKYDELTALSFHDAGGRAVGLLVNWHCHPETLDSKNTLVSADFVGYTVRALQERHGCPVVYLTGSVGGLMTSLHVELRGPDGKPLQDGTYEKTERYGACVADVADRALRDAAPVSLAPLEVRSRPLFLPMDNRLYAVARMFGVFQREAYLWGGDSGHARPAPDATLEDRLAVRTELAHLRLGDVEAAAVPGEVYPELVLGGVQDPPDPGADFPNAPVEPLIGAGLHGRHRLLLGLACDEIGYIIPKRQWDEAPPYCYGRKQAPYGEVNSLGPETAPLLCAAFRELTKGR